ncbi:MAG: hypothetical protein HC785_07870 [Calothrix sp. CSU_2_0]|nr:hypothetical protein [Calothrix sp. CSU_2_0]
MNLSGEIKILSLATIIISSSLLLGNSQASADTMKVSGQEYPLMDSMAININLNAVEASQMASGKSSSGIVKPCDRVSTNGGYECVTELSGATQYRKITEQLIVPYRPFLVRDNQSQKEMVVYIPIRVNSN